MIQMERNLVVEKIDKVTALSLIFANHYSKIMPRLTDHYLGGFLDGKLVGVITLGWGVRPVHTIKKLFPTLEREQYYEIGKMCMLESMPKNSESIFLSRTIRWLKENTSIKVLYTWADGVLGKPGYVYQSANFLYGGYIWTDLYLTAEGEKVHPRTSQGITNRTSKRAAGIKVGHRPTKEFLKKNKWSHYRGKQFRYCYFICDKREQKALLKSSLVTWSRKYPKQNDLEWTIQDLDTGDWSPAPPMKYNAETGNKNNATVQTNTTKVNVYNKAKEFFELY